MPERGNNEQYYADGIKRGDIAVLSRAITLTESSNPAHRPLARRILAACRPPEEPTFRLGVTGVPGVGKSTFIEALGLHLHTNGHRIAVLAVDPSSAKSGGSILGDKTRMQQLSTKDNVYIRPSPSAGSLGGITRVTYETIVLCEAAGFDFVIVETVGVGQSETAVSRITDFFLLLMLAGAGDELQGIKRGIMEMADAVVITKADGGNEKKAANARSEYARALRLLQPPHPDWLPPVLTASAAQGRGIDSVASMISDYRRKVLNGGYFFQHRREQTVQIFRQALDEAVLRTFYETFNVEEKSRQLLVQQAPVDPFAEVEKALAEAASAAVKISK